MNESLVCSANFPLFSAEHRDYPTYVPWAFTEEQKVFRPENLLIINDVTTFNWPSNETNRFYRQCTKLLENGIGIEGIGFQFHFFSRKSLDGYMNGDRCDPGTLLDTYELFAKLGLPLWITEITIGSAGDDGPAIQEPRRARHLPPLVRGAEDGRHHLVESGRRHRLRQRRHRWRRPGRQRFQTQAGLPGLGSTDQPRLEDQPRRRNRTPTEACRFRGFHGRYEVRVAADGKTKTFELTIHSGRPAKATLTMP